jgi:hypothetical protein
MVRNMPPAVRVFGTMAFRPPEGVRFMEPEYSPACLAFSPSARIAIRLVLVLRGFVPLGCVPEIDHRLNGVTDRQTGDSGIFGPPLAVRIVAERAGDDTRLVAVTTTSGTVG